MKNIVSIGYIGFESNIKMKERLLRHPLFENKEIEVILGNYELIKEKGSTKTVQIGCHVTVKMIDFDEEEKYEIVGVIEADPLENKISNESPLAKAILGHKIGEVVEVDVAKPYKVEIVGIEKTK